MDRESAGRFSGNWVTCAHDDPQDCDCASREAALIARNALVKTLGGLPYTQPVLVSLPDAAAFDSESDFLEDLRKWAIGLGAVLDIAARSAHDVQAERDTLRAQRDAVREFFGTGERDLGMTTW